MLRVFVLLWPVLSKVDANGQLADERKTSECPMLQFFYLPFNWLFGIGFYLGQLDQLGQLE